MSDQPASPAPSSDSAQELSPAELQTAKDALPQPPQTIEVRVSSIEKDIAALRADVAAAVALAKQASADVASALEDVAGDIAAVKALVPNAGPVGEKLVAFEQKLKGALGALEQHFGIKL